MFGGGPEPIAVDHTTSGRAATTKTMAGRGSRLPERSHQATTTKTAAPTTRTDGPPPVVIHATGAFARRLATNRRYRIGTSARSETSFPSGSQTSPSTDAAIPRSRAGETAGNAARFARIVTPGTSWKWKSSSGVTPICAAVVVPAARATGRGRNRCIRSASGDANATIPAVAATDSWKPIA